jgi:hypothetical protein
MDDVEEPDHGYDGTTATGVREPKVRFSPFSARTDPHLERGHVLRPREVLNELEDAAKHDARLLIGIDRARRILTGRR